MGIRSTTKSSMHAIHSTSAIYWVVKATEDFGPRVVLDKMTQMEWDEMQESGDGSYQQAALRASTRYDALMTLPEKGPVFRGMYEELKQEHNAESCFVPA